MDKLQGQVKPVSGYYSLQPVDNNSYIVTDALVATQVRIPPYYYNKDYPVGYCVTIINQGEPAEILLPDDLILTVPNGTTLSEPGQQCIIVKTDSLRWLVDVVKAGGGGGGDYVLPTASKVIKGGIKIGKNLTINPDATLDAPDGLDIDKLPEIKSVDTTLAQLPLSYKGDKVKISVEDVFKSKQASPANTDYYGISKDIELPDFSYVAMPWDKRYLDEISGLSLDDSMTSLVNIADYDIDIFVTFLAMFKCLCAGDKTVVLWVFDKNNNLVFYCGDTNSVSDKELNKSDFAVVSTPLKIPAGGRLQCLTWTEADTKGEKDAVHGGEFSSGTPATYVQMKQYNIYGKDGLKGDRGEPGPQGENGIQGDSGAQGPAGKDGKDGTNGKDGATGAKGDKGDTGSQGPKGDKGDPGTGGSISIYNNGVLISNDVTKINFIGELSATLVGDTVIIKEGPFEKPISPTLMCVGADQNNLIKMQINNDGKIPAGETLDYYNYKIGSEIKKVTLTSSINFQFTVDKPNTLYKIQLQLVTKSGNTSDWSKEASIITMPDGPQLLTATSTEPQTIDFTFKPNANDGTVPYTNFYYSVYGDGGGSGTIEFKNFTLKDGVYTAKITDIESRHCTANENFQICFKNNNGFGQGVMSNSIKLAIKPVSIPTPTNITANINQNRLCIARFNTISVPNDGIDYYNVKIKTATQKVIYRLYDTNLSEVSFNVDNYNENYPIQLQAVTTKGFTSDWSAVKNVIAPPGPPVIVSAYGGIATVSAVVKPNALDKYIEYQDYKIILQGTYGSSPALPVTRIEVIPDGGYDIDFGNIPGQYCEPNTKIMISAINAGGNSTYVSGPTVNITKGEQSKPAMINIDTSNKKAIKFDVANVELNKPIVLSIDRLKTDGTSWGETYSTTINPIDTDSKTYAYGNLAYSGDYNFSFQPDNEPNRWSDKVKVTIK